MARRKSSSTSGSQPLSMTDAAVMLAEYAAGVLVQPDSRSHLAALKLSPSERAILVGLPGLSIILRERLTITSRGVRSFDFTLDDLARICLAVSEALIETRDRDAVKLLSIAGKVMDRLDHAVSELAKASKPKEPGLTPTGSKLTTAIYQFKITLKDTKPPIWRRIQVRDCTIDMLHEHIQTAMGWTNSHLHHFKIDGRRYGDPMLLAETFEEMKYSDSTRTRLSDILRQSGKHFHFDYEYDFGDFWQHEVLFEGCLQAEKRRRYPLCVEGERACPPEDVGGVWGYVDFLEAIADPDNKRHEERLGWIGGSFDPENFDPVKASQRMKRGLPDWRKRV